jgi:hypothetical protein
MRPIRNGYGNQCLGTSACRQPGESAWGRIDWRCSRVPAGCCFGVSVIALAVDCLGEERASPLDPKCSRRYICGVKGRGPLSSPMASGALRAQPCSLSPFSPTKTPPCLNREGVKNRDPIQGPQFLSLFFSLISDAWCSHLLPDLRHHPNASSVGVFLDVFRVSGVPFGCGGRSCPPGPQERPKEGPVKKRAPPLDSKCSWLYIRGV